MIAAAGLVSFGGAFVFAWLTKPAPSTQSDESDGPTLADQETLKLPRPEAGQMGTVGTGDSKIKKAMPEKQLKNLVYEIRESIQEYNNRLQGLEVRERRLQTAHDMLKKDIENLNNLRVELASTVARLKSERDKLLKSRVDIAEAEKANLMSVAAAYDKMDASSASKILTNMCASGGAGARKKVFGGEGSNMNDAVKILYYMTERTKAKLLAELVNSEPKLAAVLCQRLKQIIEKK
jgi:flagellar motility protein MotE (MotC chaperone)